MTLTPAQLELIREACTPLQARTLIAYLQGKGLRELARSEGVHRATIRERITSAQRAIERNREATTLGSPTDPRVALIDTITGKAS